jgi:hypothetical protein
VPLKQFLQFLELFPALKINSKKIKLFYRIGPTLRPDPTRPRRPGRQARQGSSAEAGHGRRRRRSTAWACAPGSRAPRPYKGGGRASRRALDPRRRPAQSPRAALLELNRAASPALTRDSGRSRSSPPPVSTQSWSPRSPLRFSLGARAPSGLSRRRRHPTRPASPAAPVRPWTEVGDESCHFSSKTLRHPLIHRFVCVSCSFSREPPRKIPPFAHRSNRALL